MQRSCLFIGLWFAFLQVHGDAWGQTDGERDGTFGFDAMKIFTFHKGAGPVTTGDLDADARNDIVIFDGARGEVVVLYQSAREETGKTHGVAPNILRDPAGYRRDTLPVPLKVSAIAVLDLDRDGWNDLLLAAPGVLEVRWGNDANNLAATPPLRLRAPDALSGSSVLVTGVDGQKQSEVFLLARKGVHRFRSFSQATGAKQTLLPGSAGNPVALHLTDLDGDGRRDLLTIQNSAPNVFVVRFRQDNDEFGPEIVLAGVVPAAVCILESEHGSGGGSSIVALESGQGRLQLLRLASKVRSDVHELPAPEVFPLDATGLDDPRLLVADLDGDGDPDVVVSHSSRNELLVFMNDAGNLTASSTPSPTLREVVSLAAADVDGDGQPDLVVTSAEEGVVGASSMEGGIVRFPKPLKGDFAAPRLAVTGSFTSSGANELAVVSKEDSELQLRITREGPTVTTVLSTQSGEPRDILAADLDADGRDEILVFIPYEAPRIYAVTASQAPAGWQLEAIAAPGCLEKAARGQVSVAKNGDLLVSSGNHCRRVRLRDGKAEVVYQLNGANASAMIATTLEVRLEREGPLRLLLVDRNDKSVSVFQTDGSQPTSLRTVSGPFDRIQAGHATDLDGDGSDEVLLLDPRYLAVIRSEGRRVELSSAFTYQETEETCRYVAAATGDLNGDGVQDLVLSDGARNFLQILKASRDASWVHALRFPVFEQRSFSRRGQGPMEPRWVTVVDLTADGLDDILILVHDRLVLYPQQGTRG